MEDLEGAHPLQPDGRIVRVVSGRCPQCRAVPSGGDQSTFFVTGAGNMAGTVAGDIGGFFTGPPGDPGRIRQIATLVDAVNSDYTRAARALDDAVLTLTLSWTGSAATQFHAAWTAPTRTSPSSLLSSLSDTLTAFARELRDHADKLENAQNQHWVQLGLMAALTLLNAAQGGADPATDAAEVAAGTAMEVGADLTLTGLGEMALTGAINGFASDALSQLGADLLDRLDPQFNDTGDDAVPVFDGGQALQGAVQGALSTVDDGLGEGLGEGDGPLEEMEGGEDLELSTDLQGDLDEQPSGSAGHSGASATASGSEGPRTIGSPEEFDPASLTGMTPAEVESRIPSNWVQTPSKTGGGSRFSDPENQGRQIRVMPGYGDGVRPDPLTAGPYAVVSQNGNVVKVPLAGNPTLP
jgi:uncharacterized protein YukE